MKKAFFLLIGLAFIAGCIYFFLQKPARAKYTTDTIVQIGGAEIKVEIADTEEKRIKGLSGRENLEEGSGMFFVFENLGQYGIWMKDMNFPIDIAWLDIDKRIIWMEKAVLPETFPKVFYPPLDIMYVLEVPSGTFDKNHIDIDGLVSWK